MRTALRVLNDVHIAQPCRAAWAQMAGDDRRRHCGRCDRDVFNLSKMGSEDAVRLLTESRVDVCVRLYRRRDGTVITRDCSPALRVGARWVAWIATVLGVGMAAGCTMGAIAVPPADPATSKPAATQPAGGDRPG